MKKLLIAAAFAASVVIGAEAAPTDVVTQADIQALLERLNKLEAENKAQAETIKKLQEVQAKNVNIINDIGRHATQIDKKFELQTAKLSQLSTATFGPEGETTTNETGRIYTTGNGKKYYLADAAAHIFEPLSESGFQITPYGYLVFEGVYSDRPLDADWSADFVRPDPKANHTTLSMQDSILGMKFETPEAHKGWKFIGLAEMDLAGGDANDYVFHWRHLYFDAQHESGWSILFGQTWHLWKMVTPSEIDGAWMENTGHPYRRSPQIRVTKQWDWEDSSLNVRFGIVKNGPGMGGDHDGDGVEDNVQSMWPLFEAAAVYDRDASWQDEDADNRRWLVGVGGQYGRTRMADLNDNDDEYDSMMAMFAGAVPFGDFKLTGQIFAGQNLGGVQAGIGQTVGFDPVTGEGQGVRTIGGFLDLSYQLTADWSLAIGYGFDNPNDTDAKYDGARTFNDRAYIDAFYQVTTNFKIGIEYARLTTKYADTTDIGGDRGGTGTSDRFQFSAYYDF